MVILKKRRFVMLKDSIDILTKLMFEAHFKGELNKEAKIRLVIKVLKVVEQYE